MIQIEAILKLVEQEEKFKDSAEKIKSVVRAEVVKGTFPEKIIHHNGVNLEQQITLKGLYEFFKVDQESISPKELLAYYYNIKIGGILADDYPYISIYRAISNKDASENSIHLPTRLFYQSLDCRLKQLFITPVGTLLRSGHGAISIGRLRGFTDDEFAEMKYLGSRGAVFIRDAFKSTNDSKTDN